MKSFEVICINDAPGFHGPVPLIKGETYTATGENRFKDGWILEEVKSNSEFGAFSKARFIKKEGTSFGQTVAEKIEIEINEEVLEEA